MTDDALGEAGEGLAAQFDAAPADVAALYDDWVTTRYDADLAAWGYEAPTRAADMMSELVSEGPVLDAGCGSGLVGAELRQRGLQPIVGGDFSAVSVETARSRGIYSDVVELDLNEPLAFADGEFRAIVSIGVFSYLADSEATIRELLRVVQVGGPIVFTQRTDLWEQRDFASLLRGLADEGACDVTVSPPQPYLPLHPEFGDEIGIRYATLIRC
jgi:predicted TPR repeat methyltransferase